MKSVLISIQPKWCELIEKNKKTVEVRKTAQKETPFKVYMYKKPYAGGAKIINEVLNGVYSGGKVVGEYVCERVDNIVPSASRYMINNDIAYTNKVAKGSCLYFNDLKKYLGNKVGRALHITAVKFYDEPKEIYNFHRICNKKCSPACDWYIEHDYTECGCGGKPNITHAPRGWQFVEEI